MERRAGPAELADLAATGEATRHDQRLGAASRTAGSRTRSAQAPRDVVVRVARSPTRRPCRSSRSRARRASRPIRSSSSCSGSKPFVARPWQCPCSSARPASRAARSVLVARGTRRGGTSASRGASRPRRREQLRQLVAEDGDAARLEPDDRHARADLVAQRVERSARGSGARGRGTRSRRAAVRSRGAPAAASRGSRRAASTSTAAMPTSRLEVVRERVGPEDARGRPPPRRPRSANQRLERRARERAAAAAAARRRRPPSRARDSPASA